MLHAELYNRVFLTRIKNLHYKEIRNVVFVSLTSSRYIAHFLEEERGLFRVLFLTWQCRIFSALPRPSIEPLEVRKMHWDRIFWRSKWENKGRQVPKFWRKAIGCFLVSPHGLFQCGNLQNSRRAMLASTPAKGRHRLLGATIRRPIVALFRSRMLSGWSRFHGLGGWVSSVVGLAPLPLYYHQLL